MSRRFTAPRRGVRFPSRADLLGVVTSHGPFRESYESSRKSRGSAEAIGPQAKDAGLSAERMRAALSSAAGAPALLWSATISGMVIGLAAAVGQKLFFAWFWLASLPPLPAAPQTESILVAAGWGNWGAEQVWVRPSAYSVNPKDAPVMSKPLRKIGNGMTSWHLVVERERSISWLLIARAAVRPDSAATILAALRQAAHLTRCLHQRCADSLRSWR